MLLKDGEYSRSISKGLKPNLEHLLTFHQIFCTSFKNETNEIAKLIIILSPPGMEQLFVEIGLEVSDINIKPPPFTNEQIQKLLLCSYKYGMEIKLN